MHGKFAIASACGLYSNLYVGMLMSAMVKFVANKCIEQPKCAPDAATTMHVLA